MLGHVDAIFGCSASGRGGIGGGYRVARDPVERSRWQMIWLLVSGRPLDEVAAVTGYSTRWMREVVRRYNAVGPDALADQRRRNPGAAPLLDAAGQAALEEALRAPPVEGGRWTGRERV